ncbi:hypothetical protein ACFQVC_03055 [Streptomyces monticola]|uniref:AG2 protein n=1 Tax=Streptomyces monticola TaxID=2666263 RepID=A0ABW2JB25_9ACTN
MPSVQELLNLRLGKLNSAVTDWQQMVGKLEKLADGGGDGGASAAELLRRTKAANWKGVNATVSREFTVKTADQFQDILSQARSVHAILSGAHTKLEKNKQDLKDAITRAKGKGLHMSPDGRVEPLERRQGPALRKPTQQDVDTAAAEIKAVLEAAAETDATAATALRFHARDKHDFGSTGFKSFDAAEQTIKDSNSFVKLAGKDPSELSNKELTQLNTLMKRNAGDLIFADRVATGVGPEGTLKFWANAVDLDKWLERGTHAPGEKEQRMKLLGTLEKQLGGTLGTATRLDTDAMDSWKGRVVALGDDLVRGTGASGSVYGFQAMSNLLRHGKYEGGFLNSYGNALVAYEKKHTGDVKDPGPGGRSRENVLPWDKLPSYAKPGQLHYGSEGDAGTDPMTGFMQALSNNPDASTDFFNADKPQDNAKWVLKDRPVFNDAVVGDGFGASAEDYKGPRAVYEATGDALTAAATGIDPSDKTAKAVEHTAGHREVLDNSLKYLSQRKEDFPAELRDDMAKILVNYGDEVHHTASAQSDDRDDPRQLDRRQLLDVSRQISRDQDAYGLLHDGINREIVRDIHQGEPDDPKETLLRGGRTLGFLEEARYQALADHVAAEKQDAAWKQNWSYHGAGTVTSLIPYVGPAAGALDRELYLISYQWRLDEEARITAENQQQNGETFTVRENQLREIAKIWHARNPDGPEDVYNITEQLTASAANGNATAQGLPGRQPAH